MKVNIVKACKQLYGQKDPKVWPGVVLNNLNDFANACYGSCARFNNLQSISQVLDLPCGVACQYAMKQQLELNGKTPCENWLPAPMISLPPHVSFINEYNKLGNIPNRGEKARQNALSQCKTAKCKDEIELDSLAYSLSNPSLTKPNPPPKPKPKSPKPNNNCCAQPEYYVILGSSIGLLVIFLIVYMYMDRKKKPHKNSHKNSRKKKPHKKNL